MHSLVGVIIPRSVVKVNTKPAVDFLMKPFDENEEVSFSFIHEANYGPDPVMANPRGKWDWYRIGGRWHGWATPEPKQGFNFDLDCESQEVINLNRHSLNDLHSMWEVGDLHYPAVILTWKGEWIENPDWQTVHELLNPENKWEVQDWDFVAVDIHS